MSLQLESVEGSPPKIEITDVNGHLIMNTNTSLFHATDYLSGAITLNAWGSPPHNGGADYTIGTCHVDSNFLRASVKITYSGTNLWMFPQSGRFQLSSTFTHIATTQAVRFFSFVIENGVVKLKDRIYSQSVVNEFGQQLGGLPSMGVYFDMYIGRFSP